MPSNPLTDIIPAKARRYVYAVLWLTALVFGTWRATDGDVVTFVAALLAALGFGTAQSNTHPEV